MAVISSAAFWAPVVYRIPGDMGAVETIDCKARFKRLKTSERKALMERLQAGQVTDKEFLDAVMTDWSLHTKSGETIPYTEANRAEQVEDSDGFEAALVQAYFRAFEPVADAAKNSVAPSATT